MNTQITQRRQNSYKIASKCDFDVYYRRVTSVCIKYFINLQEEALRQKRLASSRSGIGNESSSSRGGHASGSSHDSFTVQAMSPDATALSTTYIYAALFVLVLGIIIGKWIF